MTKPIDRDRDQLRLGSERRPLIEWPSYKVTLTRRRPTVAEQDRYLPRYQPYLAALGLTDPTAGGERYAIALALRAAAGLGATVRSQRSDIVDRLASGALSPAEAAKLKRPDPREAEQRQIVNRQDLLTASRAAARAALEAISAHDWPAVLKAIAREAVAARDQVAFSTTHKFAGWLRDIGALSAAMSGPHSDSGLDLYMFGRPDLAYRSRVDRTSDKDKREMWRAPDDAGNVRVAYSLGRGAPFPAVRDFQPEWQPGLYTAEEVVANIAAALSAQEQDFARLTQREASPKPQPRAAMI